MTTTVQVEKDIARAAPAAGPQRGPHGRGAIVGAGFSGLGMAIRLKERDIDDFVVLERGEDAGGTWRDNIYPGTACDVPSHLYSFSFAPNPNWTRTYSPQREIRDYLRRTAWRSGVEPHIRYGHEVRAAAWDDDGQRWRIDTAGALSPPTCSCSATVPWPSRRSPPYPASTASRARCSTRRAGTTATT